MVIEHRHFECEVCGRQFVTREFAEACERVCHEKKPAAWKGKDSARVRFPDYHPWPQPKSEDR